MNVFTDKSALQLQEVHVLENVIFFPPFWFFMSDPHLIKKQQKTTTELLFHSELQIKIEGLKKAKVKCIYKQVFFLFQN